jgi:hypothetical protein
MDPTTVFQTIAIGITLGSMYGVLGTGFGIIFGVSGRFHFAFATTFVLTIYIATSFTEAGVPLYIGILGGIAAAAISGVLFEWLFYRPLVRRSPATALLGVFVTSLGLVFVGENLIRLIWGSETRTLDTGFDVSQISLGGDVVITNLDVASVVVCVVLVAALVAYLKMSKQGKAIRAVRENPGMATVVGISPERAGRRLRPDLQGPRDRLPGRHGQRSAPLLRRRSRARPDRVLLDGVVRGVVEHGCDLRRALRLHRGEPVPQGPASPVDQGACPTRRAGMSAGKGDLCSTG